MIADLGQIVLAAGDQTRQAGGLSSDWFLSDTCEIWRSVSVMVAFLYFARPPYLSAAGKAARSPAADEGDGGLPAAQAGAARMVARAAAR